MLGPLANGLATVIDMVINMLQLLIAASILASWIGDPNHQIVAMIRSITEPMYRPIRKITKGLPGPIDWAPFVLMLVLVFIQRGLVPYIVMLGQTN
jgi:YggT family protein